jgi:hypothetical protein
MEEISLKTASCNRIRASGGRPMPRPSLQDSRPVRSQLRLLRARSSVRASSPACSCTKWDISPSPGPQHERSWKPDRKGINATGGEEIVVRFLIPLSHPRPYIRFRRDGHSRPCSALSLQGAIDPKRHAGGPNSRARNYAYQLGALCKSPLPFDCVSKPVPEPDKSFLLENRKYAGKVEGAIDDVISGGPHFLFVLPGGARVFLQGCDCCTTSYAHTPPKKNCFAHVCVP